MNTELQSRYGLDPEQALPVLRWDRCSPRSLVTGVNTDNSGSDLVRVIDLDGPIAIFKFTLSRRDISHDLQELEAILVLRLPLFPTIARVHFKEAPLASVVVPRVYIAAQWTFSPQDGR